VTVQNEPGVDRSKEKDPKWHYPSCHWTSEQERDFIREHLGPTFRRAGITTKIWCYDHNYNVDPKSDSDGLAHPRAVLSDPRTAAFVDGVAFHHYEGQPDGMSLFHKEFPRTPIHFTEGSLFSIYGGHDLIERLRNWATSFNAWVCLLDEKGGPNNGPFPSTIAILRLQSTTLEVEPLLEYYNYGHFMKFIQRGARRIESSAGTSELNNIAFQNPDKSMVAVLVNTTEKPKAVAFSLAAKKLEVKMLPKSISTFVWTP
jgi:glucosylceramidase